MTTETTQSASPDIVGNKKYCPACGKVLHESAATCPSCGAAQIVPIVGQKSKIAAALLAFFLGGIGIHKFYLGRPVQGLLYLVFCWTFIPALIAFIEFIIYLCMSDEAFAAKYG
ncbi:TM2 domain-containing protein [Woodsholea maritima]|uniref:TM2 domain-containing protein n=1 Tax=Woodsholea maritima TaxID=240237 RepID=UPI0003624BCD|nr:NINE protein [Woodsholea maritima]